MPKFNITTNKTCLIIGVLIVFSICFSFRCYRFEQREALHIDEAMSVVISNCKTIGWGEAFEDDSRMFTGAEMKAAFYSGDNSLEATAKDITQLWKDTRDPVHSNVYYILLRASFIGADTAVYDQVLLRAFILNILLFLISFFFIFKLIRLLTDNNWIIWGILAMAFISHGSIYSTLTFREYQYQETMFSILAYIGAVIFFKIDKGEILMGYKKIVLYALVIALTFHTGYFAVAYAGMIWGGLFLMAVMKKEYKTSQFLALTFILSLIFTIAIYPNFFAAIGSDRGDEAMKKFQWESIISNITSIIFDTPGQLERYHLGVYKLAAIFGMIAAAAIYRYRKGKAVSKEVKLCAILFFISSLWILFVLFLSPWKGAHYFRAIFPLFSVGLMGMLFLQRIKIFYPLLAIYPIFLFWVSCLNFDRYPEAKDNTPIIFAGHQDYYNQFYDHELFNDERLIGFSLDRQNLESKMKELDNYAAVAIDLENDFSKYTSEKPTARLDSLYKYVDTTKYEVIGRRFHRSFRSIFLLKERDSLLINNEQMHVHKDFLRWK